MTGAGGRPRERRVDDAVLDATIGLLHARGYAGLRIDDIATEAKTAKTTIYRRWPSLVHLVVAAMERALGDRGLSSTGHLAADLDRLVDAGLGPFGAGGSPVLAVALDIDRQRDDGLRSIYRRRIIDPVREHAVALVTAAIHRGELGPDVHPRTVVDAVIGGLIYRAAVLAEPVSVEEAKEFWRDVLGMRPPRARARGTTHDAEV